MPTRKYNQNTLYNGQWNVICDVCGFKFKSNDIKERWDGLRVCKEDWEVRHPMDFQRGFKDDQSVPYSRPDGDVDGTATGTDINGDPVPAELLITTLVLDEVNINIAFEQQLETNIVPTPIPAWSIVSGTLPTGITLGATTGILSGTTTEAGDFAITVQVVDGVTRTDTQAYTFTIGKGAPVSWSLSTIPPPNSKQFGIVGSQLKLNDDSVIIAGGASATDAHHVIYDPVAETWAANGLTVAAFDGQGCNGVALENGDFILIGYGAPFEDDIYYYDATLTTWTLIGTRVVSYDNHQPTVDYDGKIWFFGANDAWNGRSRAHLWTYEYGTNTWAQLTDMPQSMRFNDAVRIKGTNNVLVGGGQSRTSAAAPVDQYKYYIYGLDTGLWTQVSDVPVGLHQIYTVCQIGLDSGDVLLGGGQIGGIDTNKSFLYKPNTDSWEASVDFPFPTTHGSDATSSQQYNVIEWTDGDLAVIPQQIVTNIYISSI